MRAPLPTNHHSRLAVTWVQGARVIPNHSATSTAILQTSTAPCKNNHGKLMYYCTTIINFFIIIYLLLTCSIISLFEYYYY